MNLNLTPYVIGWAILAAVVIGLALYRRSLANKEDDSLHVSDMEADKLAEQMKFAQRLEKVDLWGKILTVIAVLYGLALAAGYLYQAWQEGNVPR